MPKIHTLTTDTEITGTDKLLGSDGATGAGNATKNYLVSSLKTYMLDDSSLVKTTGDQTLAGVKTFSGSIVGDVTGDLTGDVTGDLTGNVVGNVTGNLTGNVTGNVTGDVTGDLTGNADTVTNGVYTTGDQT